jgi:DNA repair exonuclease SbcCD nuclease subunit
MLDMVGANGRQRQMKSNFYSKCNIVVVRGGRERVYEQEGVGVVKIHRDEDRLKEWKTLEFRTRQATVALQTRDKNVQWRPCASWRHAGSLRCWAS